MAVGVKYAMREILVERRGEGYRSRIQKSGRKRSQYTLPSLGHEKGKRKGEGRDVHESS